MRFLLTIKRETMMPFDRTDLPEITRERLLTLGARPGDRFVVALSGGQDSTALLLAVSEGWGRGGLAAAHLDHAVREGSGKDREWVLSLCRRLGVEVRTGRLDREKVMLAARREGSLEAAMRGYRYDFLMSSAASMGANWVLTGHTATDQVETVLFRIQRGMDPMALSGIPEKRGRILRPFLVISRDQAYRYCMGRGVEPLFDPSNTDMRFARNRIRYRMIPALKKTFHPDLEKHLLRLSSLVRRFERAEEILIERFSDRNPENAKVLLPPDSYRDLPEVLREPAARRFLHSVTGRRPSRARVREALEHLYGQKKGRMSLPGGKIMDSGGSRTYIYDIDMDQRRRLPEERTLLTVPGSILFEEAGIVVTAHYRTLGDPDRIPAGDTAAVAQKGLQGPLWVRRRLPGDRFRPLGMEGAKKLKNYFIDRKIPRHERDRIPIITDDEGEILWVAGLEISGRAALEGYYGERMVVLKVKWDVER